MKKVLRATVFLILCMALTTQAGIIISEVMPDSSHDKDVTNDNGDWFEITNTGSNAVDLSGWSWVDDKDSHDKLAFPAVTIAAGESIICLEESSADDWLSSWDLSNSGITVLTEDNFTDSSGENDFHGLGTDGDTVFIYDGNSNLVDFFSWTDASEGISIDVYNGGVNSQVCVNGAWASDDVDVAGNCDDIASPGVVPEPCSLALIGLGVALLRRRK